MEKRSVRTFDQYIYKLYTYMIFQTLHQTTEPKPSGIQYRDSPSIVWANPKFGLQTRLSKTMPHITLIESRILKHKKKIF